MHRRRRPSLIPRVALIIAVFLLFCHVARADDVKRLAVLEFVLAQRVNIDRTYFSDLARGAVKKGAPQFFVMTRENTETLLQANGKTMADCEGECEIEMGRKLGADYIISGRITQIGSTLILTLRLSATADGSLLADEEASGKSPDQLLGNSRAAVDRMVKTLGATFNRGAPEKTATPTTAVHPHVEARASLGATKASLSAEDIKKKLGDHKAALQSCVDEALRKEPNLRVGKIHIATTIAPSGAVTSARIDNLSVDESALGACLKRATKRIIFDRFSGGEFEVDIPILVTAGD